MSMPLPLSVIVRTHNSSRTIEQCLAHIRKSAHVSYELIVVDSASIDGGLLIAHAYADKIIECKRGSALCDCLQAGIEAAKGEIIVNIDSDILIEPDTLGKITAYFSTHSSVDAVTGILSLHSPSRGFFSQYKNIYMHYMFRRLPERITFLYGSIFGIRKTTPLLARHHFQVGEDTAWGQHLVSIGRQIVFLKDLEVIHLKKHTFGSFIRNDFKIPFYWARIFIRYKGWKQLGHLGTGFAHSSVAQLVSLIIAVVLVLIGSRAFFYPQNSYIVIALACAWFGVNAAFFRYIAETKGLVFCFGAVGVTFLDNIVMASGILCGIFSNFFRRF